MSRIFPFLLICFLASCTHSPSDSVPVAPPKPNIIYVLADDLGYGDLSCYQAGGKISTPHLDRLASQGMLATNAHAPASICTPTRYGVLTGRYSWRSRMKQGVVWSYGPAILEPQRTTLPEFLQQAGYHTACIGKWHLGLDWARKGEAAPTGQQLSGLYTKAEELSEEQVDLSQPITDGPPQHGFDYSFILPASLDIPPYTFVENNQLISPPTAHTPGNDLNTGYTKAFWREGAMSPDFDFEAVLPTFIDRSISYVEKHAQSEQPFFLYLPLPAPHTPWLPVDSFVDHSQAGMYGDFVKMVDAEVGRLLSSLEESGQAGETLIIFTSDNGPYWRPQHIAETGHRAAGSLKGMKGDIWEGGHRVPFLASWPGHIPAGSRSDALMSLTDAFASIAAILEGVPPANEAGDSFNQWPQWVGDASAPERPNMVHHSSRNFFALRSGPWKYIPHAGSGGFTPPEDSPVDSLSGQLYQLGQDLSEQQNLWGTELELQSQFQQALDSVIGNSLDSW
ncbi:MAG: arylsulfatase [Bacteroidota bacterium]